MGRVLLLFLLTTTCGLIYCDDCNDAPLFISRFIPAFTKVMNETDELLFLGVSSSGSIILRPNRTDIPFEAMEAKWPVDEAVPSVKPLVEALAMKFCLPPYQFMGPINCLAESNFEASTTRIDLISWVVEREEDPNSLSAIFTVNNDFSKEVFHTARTGVEVTYQALNFFSRSKSKDPFFNITLNLQDYGLDEKVLDASYLSSSILPFAEVDLSDYVVNCSTYPTFDPFSLPSISMEKGSMGNAIYGEKPPFLASVQFQTDFNTLLDTTTVRNLSAASLISRLTQPEVSFAQPPSPKKQTELSFSYQYPGAVVGGAVRDILRQTPLPDIHNIDFTSVLPYHKLEFLVEKIYGRAGVTLVDSPGVMESSGLRREFGMLKIEPEFQDGEMAAPYDIGIFKVPRIRSYVHHPEEKQTNILGDRYTEYFSGYSFLIDASTRDYTFNAIYALVDFREGANRAVYLIDPLGRGVDDNANNTLLPVSSTLFPFDLGGQLRFWKFKRKGYYAPVSLEEDVCVYMSWSLAQFVDLGSGVPSCTQEMIWDARYFVVKTRKKLYDPEESYGGFQNRTDDYFSYMMAAANRSRICNTMLTFWLALFQGTDNCNIISPVLRSFPGEDPESRPVFWVVSSWKEVDFSHNQTILSSEPMEMFEEGLLSRFGVQQKEEEFPIAQDVVNAFLEIDEEDIRMSQNSLSRSICILQLLNTFVQIPLLPGFQNFDVSNAFDNTDLTSTPDGFFRAYSSLGLSPYPHCDRLLNKTLFFVHNIYFALTAPVGYETASKPLTLLGPVQQEVLGTASYGIDPPPYLVYTVDRDIIDWQSTTQSDLALLYNPAVDKYHTYLMTFAGRVGELRVDPRLANVSLSLADASVMATPNPVPVHLFVLMLAIPAQNWAKFGLFPFELSPYVSLDLKVPLVFNQKSYSTDSVDQFLDIVYQSLTIDPALLVDNVTNEEVLELVGLAEFELPCFMEYPSSLASDHKMLDEKHFRIVQRILICFGGVTFLIWVLLLKCFWDVNKNEEEEGRDGCHLFP